MSEVRVELPFKPHAHQRAAHAMLAFVRFLVLVWHRRAGKTVFAVVELLLAAAACKRERGRFGYISPFLKQSKSVAWEYVKHFAAVIPGCTVNEGELWVELPNGARVWLFGADNPDALRGLYFDGIVLDEVADMRPEIWAVIIRPALTDRQGWAIFIGTPKGTNLFSELYYRALRGEDGWKADLKRAADTGVIPAEEIEKAKREMAPPQFAQEFECDFAAAVENVLLRLEDILAAQQRIVPDPEFEDEVRILGVDVARFGDDRTVMFKRQGRATFVPRVYRGLDTMQVAGESAAIIDDWHPAAVFVDQTGVGGGVVDRLRQLGYEVIGVDSAGKPLTPGKYADRRAEMWCLAAEWICEGGGALIDDQELATELSAPTYWFDKNNHKRVESKKDLKARGLKSPDKADAFTLTFAAPVAHPDIRARTPNLANLFLSGTNLGRRRGIR